MATGLHLSLLSLLLRFFLLLFLISWSLLTPAFYCFESWLSTVEAFSIKLWFLACADTFVLMDKRLVGVDSIFVELWGCFVVGSFMGGGRKSSEKLSCGFFCSLCFWKSLYFSSCLMSATDSLFLDFANVSFVDAALMTNFLASYFLSPILNTWRTSWYEML